MILSLLASLLLSTNNAKGQETFETMERNLGGGSQRHSFVFQENGLGRTDTVAVLAEPWDLPLSRDISVCIGTGDATGDGHGNGAVGLAERNLYLDQSDCSISKPNNTICFPQLPPLLRLDALLLQDLVHLRHGERTQQRRGPRGGAI